jgi:hypothetical protein
MKDYKEMTESVLQQANARAAQRTRQRRMATGLIAATLCFAILIAVVGFGVGRNPAGTTQPTISLENPTTVPTTQPETTEPETKPASTERTVVSVEVYNDCDDSGHGVKVITYSDGTQEEVYF